MKLVALIVASLVLSCAVSAQQKPTVPLGRTVRTISDKDGALTFQGITGRRDLTMYDDGGSLDCRAVRPAESKTPEVTNARVKACHLAARQFVWQHWQFKKRGYLRLTANSVDTTSTQHIFVEPTARGDWQIVLKTVRDYNRVNESVVREVQRREMNNGFVLFFRGEDGSFYCALWDNC